MLTDDQAKLVFQVAKTHQAKDFLLEFSKAIGGVYIYVLKLCCIEISSLPLTRNTTAVYKNTIKIIYNFPSTVNYIFTRSNEVNTREAYI